MKSKRDGLPRAARDASALRAHGSKAGCGPPRRLHLRPGVRPVVVGGAIRPTRAAPRHAADSRCWSRRRRAAAAPARFWAGCREDRALGPPARGSRPPHPTPCLAAPTPHRRVHSAARKGRAPAVPLRCVLRPMRTRSHSKEVEREDRDEAAAHGGLSISVPKKRPTDVGPFSPERKLLLLALVFGFVLVFHAIHFFVVHFAAGMAGSKRRNGSHHECSDHCGDESFHRLPLGLICLLRPAHNGESPIAANAEDIDFNAH